MLIYDVLKSGQKKLKENHLPEVEARYLLEHLLNIDFTQLVNLFNSEISQDVKNKHDELIEKRIKNYPFQYIIHMQRFYESDFFVNEDVLIPRQETELLVSLSIEQIKRMMNKSASSINNVPRHMSILDMCTGSGCIIISVVKVIEQYLQESTEHNNSNNIGQIDMVYTGVDISKEALSVAKRNEMEILKTPQIQWIQSDLFENVATSFNQELEIKHKKFDIIISNPPYINEADFMLLDEGVKNHEPNIALLGGKDGLDFYRRIISESHRVLNDEGMLLFEIGYDQREVIILMMQDKGFTNIQCIKDIGGFDRIVYGIKLNKPD